MTRGRWRSAASPGDGGTSRVHDPDRPMDVRRTIATGTPVESRSELHQRKGAVADDSEPHALAVNALSHRQVLVVVGGVVLGVALAALDQTVVSTALPTMVTELGGLEHLPWVVSVYLLTSSAAMPIFGRISDVHGRKRLFQLAIIIFMLASVVAGSAQNMPQLIGSRAFQGIGGGGLIVLAQVIVGDIVSPRQRGRYIGYLAATFAVSSAAGPLFSGFLVDNLSWRWVFYINLPLGLLALAVTNSVLNLSFRRTRNPIDFLGAALLVGGITCILLATTWIGVVDEGRSRAIVSLALGIALLFAFILQETRTAEPIMPMRLFRNRTFNTFGTLAIIAGFAMFSSIAFLPLFLQIVMGASATESALLLLPFLIGIPVASAASGRAITTLGKYRIFPIAGTAAMFLGFYLLGATDADTSRVTAAVYMFVLGTGTGLVLQVLVLAVQNSVEYRDLGIATSSIIFFRSLGGAFGTSILGALLTTRLSSQLPQTAWDATARGMEGGLLQASPGELNDLPARLHHAVVDVFADSFHELFLWMLPVVALGFILTISVREIPLKESAHVGLEPHL